MPKRKKDPLLNTKTENTTDYLENIIALIPGHIFWKDLNCRFLGCNDLQAKIAGLNSRHEIVGKSAYDVISKNQPEKKRREQAKAIDKVDQEIMRTGIPLIIEEPLITDDGIEKVFLSQKIPLRDANKNIIGLLGIAIDITERKKMEEDLRIAKEKAEAANYIMTEFISNTGHILVTPMSKISGAGTVLLYGFSDKYLELKPYFEEIMEGCADWDKAYSQVIKGTSMSEMELKIETFSINEELQNIVSINIVSIMEHTKGAKKIELILNTLKSPEDLIETDRLKFHLIIVELVYNAIKFTEEGKIIITLIKENDWFHIEVRDTGIGIPADKLGYIFKQYTMLSRAQKYGAEFKGVGAGLFLNEQRAKLLNAKISVSSEEGKGSTFTLSIPSKLNKV